MKNSVATARSGLYVHVPFCLTKCPYCDFYSVTDLSQIDDLLGAILREASLYSESRQFGVFDTLYVGGGTPSLLSTGQMARLLSNLYSSFPFDPSREVTIEVNPDDVTIEKLRDLSDEGVNRLSIGVQSFRDKDLAFLKRRHNAQASKRAVESAIETGFRNVSIDLIYALPGQTKRSWLGCLEQAVRYPISHISCYQLTLAEGTPFGRMNREGNLKPAGEVRERDLFLLTSEFLEAHGFVHYEISNYARKAGRADIFSLPSGSPNQGEVHPALLGEGVLLRAPIAMHNTKYWTHAPYLGLGPSAHSFKGTTRWWNCKSVQEYCKLLKEGRNPTAGREELAADQLRLERLYLGFRTQIGAFKSDVEDSDNGGQTLSDLVDSGLLTIVDDRVVPTRKGYLIADHLPLLFA